MSIRRLSLGDQQKSPRTVVRARYEGVVFYLGLTEFYRCRGEEVSSPFL